MKAGDRDPQHVTTTIGYVRKIVAPNDWLVAADINSDGVHRFVGTLRERKRGNSNRTVQAYLTAAKSFTKWLAQNHKLPFDPLADVQKPTPRTGSGGFWNMPNGIGSFARLKAAPRPTA